MTLTEGIVRLKERVNKLHTLTDMELAVTVVSALAIIEELEEENKRLSRIVNKPRKG